MLMALRTHRLRTCAVDARSHQEDRRRLRQVSWRVNQSQVLCTRMLLVVIGGHLERQDVRRLAMSTRFVWFFISVVKTMPLIRVLSIKHQVHDAADTA